MKFRFQVNGVVDLQDESVGIKEVSSYLTKYLEGGAARITGVSVFEMETSRKRGKTKLLQ